MGQLINDVFEIGLTELIGIDEEVNTDDMSGSVAVTVGPNGPVSGTFKAFAFISSDGAILEPTGALIILDADPAVSSGDTAMTVAEYQSVVGIVNVASGDWLTADANAAVAYVMDEIPFHSVETLYFVFDYTLATDFNDGSGDDELLQVNAWFQRED